MTCHSRHSIDGPRYSILLDSSESDHRCEFCGVEWTGLFDEHSCEGSDRDYSERRARAVAEHAASRI
jgi:hypothetical protein